MKKTIFFTFTLIAISSIASATVTFQQLDENTFTVSHRVKWIGSRGQAMDLVYEKAASLCIAAGYTHLKIMGQESNANGQDQSANATLTVKLYQVTGEDRIACKKKASEEYIEQAKVKLDKRGYKPPVPTNESTESQETENHCTVEQITAMVKAGLSENQIKAACSENS